ncbi:probable glucan 1,3-beta-glucosidase A [Chenopodium quinoa]|uniref:probable glucan 1,3-beta-glucosidase A n=1 Tax=Chenopodium quinoa TaxID=63459 RepID=UPI000B770897|nr:probable glucan 1,3-beta-glucosidase A [Chenopodium quinoa]
MDRIPVGWWIPSDPTPPKPFVGGSLQTLDNAFTWAQYVFFYFSFLCYLHNDLLICELWTYGVICVCRTCRKYGNQVIVDLHAAPGSQNGNEHSGTRDGYLEWGKTDATVQQSVAVIHFLASRLVMLW